MSSEEAHQAWVPCSAGVPSPACSPRGRARDLAGFLATHPKPLPCSKTPAELTRPRPYRPCQHRPPANQTERLSGDIISRLTQGFSFRCLRFTSDVTASHARLASGWRAAPLPGGCRTLWVASKGFRLHPILLSRTSPVARLVYAKRPFGGPDAVARLPVPHTHQIAIANSRLVAFDGERVTFKWKDYRAKADNRYKLMTLDVDEFIRRFLIYVLPDGFHRIRHYGLFANANRAGNIALARHLLGVPDPAPSSDEGDGAEDGLEYEEWNACTCCGGRMIIIETFAPGCQPRLWPIPSIGLDSS